MVSGGVWTMSGWCLRVSGTCLDVIYVIWIEHSRIGVIIYSYCFFSQCPQIGYTGTKVEIKNQRWPYFFSQLDPMLFRVFGPKLTQKSPPGPPPVNSNFGGLPPPLLLSGLSYWVLVSLSSQEIHIYEYLYLTRIINNASFPLIGLTLPHLVFLSLLTLPHEVEPMTGK